ncbi:MAG: phosphatidylglycerol lysyltransferase domain-containing protein [Thermoplasmata archaeon]|nr:phosphatidylglycerol lysyltransferase domain-containing protein [Thermoplasmata archaeon]
MASFPDFEPLGLEHKELKKVLLTADPSTSEMCFGSLFIWQDTYPAYIARIRNGFVLRGEEEFLMPVCERNREETEKIVNEIEGHNMAIGRRTVFKFTPKDCASFLKERGYNVVEDRDNFDYLYLTEHLATLPGQKYYSKRKDIKKFVEKAAGKAEFLELKQDHLEQCLRLNLDWIEEKNLGRDFHVMAEHRALERAVRHYNELEFLGYGVLLDGKVVGFTIAEPLNKETVVVHFEKGDYRLSGIYQYINQKFAETMLGKYKYINREQDLGIPGLRKAKESYHPLTLVEKYTCTKSQ